MPKSTDLREEAIALRDALALLQRPPEGTGHPALRAAWESIVAPRLERLAGRLDGLADAGAWVLDDDDEAVRLKPDRWDAALADLSGLYATLAEVLVAYRSVRVELAAPEPEPRPKPRGAAKAKAKAERPTRRRREPEAHETLAKLAEGITESLEGQRAFLQEMMEAVQRLVANVQKAEETWLRPECELCFVGRAELAERTRTLFENMRVGRLNALAFEGEAAGDYAALLRDGWRAHHLEVLAMEDPSRAGPLPPSARTSEPSTLPTSPIASTGASGSPASTTDLRDGSERRPPSA